MVKSKAELQREIEKTSSEYTDEELFSSPYFYEHLQQTINAVCHKLKRTPKIDAFCSVANNTTACTEGSTVTINTLGPLIREMPTSWEKYINIFGHITHECGHVLYTDFTALNPLREKWALGKFEFYPKTPDIAGAEEFAEYLNTHPNYRNIFVHEMLNMANIMEDVYIENRLYEDFDGLCSAGLHKTNDEKYRLSLPFEEMASYLTLGKITPLSLMNYFVQLKKLGYEPKETKGIKPDFVDMWRQFVYTKLNEIDSELTELAWESNGLKRCDLLNRIFVKLQDCLPKCEELENMKNPFGSSGDGDYSESEAQSIKEGVDNLSRANGVSEEAKGSTAPATSKKPDKEASKENKAKADKYSKSEEACSDALKKASKEVAKEECEYKDETEHIKELQKEAKEIKSEHSTSRGKCSFSKYNISRESKQYVDVSAYQRIYSDVKRRSASLVKKLGDILKERERDSFESGLLMGQRFNSTDVFHNDGKYFSRMSEPEAPLQVVFGILVDMSGSMGGNKIALAKKTAILLEDVLRKLNIPLMICGHTSHGSECSLYPYVDFNTNDGYDKYRLASIQASGCNIDGAAIAYVGDKLLKRPEQLKVLIVISDGQPCSTSFFTQSDPDKDTEMAAEHYRKKGVKVYGAIIDNVDAVMKIYSPKYSFDCSDLKLEPQLVRLIKKEISLLK